MQPTGPRRIRWDNAPGTMTGSTRMTLPPVERTPAFAFLESPLDRAEHLRDDAGVLAARWPRARVVVVDAEGRAARSEEHTSELQSLMRISYAVFCLKKKKHTKNAQDINIQDTTQKTTTNTYTKIH